MRGIATYLMAGILVVLAMDFVAPPVGLGLAVGASPMTERAAPAQTQFVDRTHKGDRLSIPTSVGKQQVPQQHPAVMIGCDPPFSRLSARVNIPGRCVAEIAHPVAG
jgi:hypothetical protein